MSDAPAGSQPDAVAPAAPELHREVFKQNKTVQLLIDPESGRILEGNEAACRFYGYTREQLAAMTIQQINTLPASEIAQCMGLAASQRKNAFSFRHRLASGEIRDVEVQSGPVEVGGRRVLYSVIHDVTDRNRGEEELQRATEALRRSEEKHRAILESIEEGYYELDRSGSLTLVNDALCRITGYPRDELLGMRHTDLTDAETSRRLDAAFSAAAKSGRGVKSLEWTIRRKDGTSIHVAASATVVRDPEGHSVGLRGVIRDVTERKLAEDELRQSHQFIHQIISSAGEGMIVYDRELRYVVWNPFMEQLTGLMASQVLGRKPSDLFPHVKEGGVYDLLRGALEGQTLSSPDVPYHVPTTGRSGWVSGTYGPHRDASGAINGVIGVVRDVTERKRAERLQSTLYRIAETASSVENMDAFYTTIHVVVAELMYARNFYIALEDELDGVLHFPYFVDEHDEAPPALKPGKTLTGYVLRTGEPLWASPAVFDELLASGIVEAVGSSSVDWLGVPLKRGERAFGVLAVQSYNEAIRFSKADKDLLTFVSQHVAAAIDRKRAADALRESEARFRTLADTAPCAIFIYQGARFLYANDATAAISGYTRDDLEQMSFWDMVHPDFREMVRERGLARLRGEPAPNRYEFKITTKAGDERWVDFSAGSIEYGGQSATLGTGFDITERKRAEEQIKNIAYHDALTGLPNRLLFHDRLQVAVAQAHRQRQRLAVLFLDLDRFKLINDSLGHTLGDRLLKAVAERLAECVREGDTVARLGGDEFTLLLPGVARAVDVAKIAEKILESLRRPFRLEERELFVTASMGISLYPDDGDEPESLIKNADTAMYRAKDQGRDTYQLYTPAMNATALERLALENGLRKALAQNELELYYQPLLDIATGHVHGVEALLRWRHSEMGLVSPSEFVPLAEVTGLILPIGAWVLRTACAQLKDWQQRIQPGLCVAVNLSARQFQQPDIVAVLTRALDEAHLEPRFLDLEITESNAMQSAESTAETLRQMKALGVRISIDDFGIGYSSLSYLKRLPIDTLKIDQSFVRDITTDPDDATIVTAVIAMAQTLHLTVVAEGVETEEQLAFLAARRCDRMQGFFFSRPLPAAECEELLLRHRKR